jgi:adenylyltransferase/sulfurtransferase
MEAENERLQAEVAALRARLAQLEGASGSGGTFEPAATDPAAGGAGGGGGTAADAARRAAPPPAPPAAPPAAPPPAPPPAAGSSYVSPHGLTKVQAERYSRQLLLPAFGPAAQAALCRGSVLIVGCGGLGAPAALYLAAAGVGRIGLADHDAVEASNLHRQVIHTEAAAAAATHKAESAAAAVRALNSGVALELHAGGLTPANAAGLAARYDVLLDASDNAPTRYLLSDAAAATGRPLVSAAAVGTDGQLTVYCHGEDGPCYRCGREGV